MKSFKIREGIVHIDGVLYGQTPNELKVKGKVGIIQSIGIPNKGQFFPIGGGFIDSSDVSTNDVVGTKSLGKTELKEESSIPVGIDGKPIKVRKTKSK